MKFLIIFVTITLMASQIQAFVLDNSIAEEILENSKESLELELNCEELFCPRVYSPICVSFNNKRITVGSMCHLKNLLCERRNAQDTESKFEILNFGECEELSSEIKL